MMRKRNIALSINLILLSLSLMSLRCQRQEKDNGGVPTAVDSLMGKAKDERLTLIFAGDIMTHGPQIEAARQADGSYDFRSCFDSILPLMRGADLRIGNLETTFGGSPYSGYPMFSSPDALGVALKASGFDVLTTANNHAVDRSGKGIVRTLAVLDSLGIKTTGSYTDRAKRETCTPLMLTAKGIKIAILAYTYGTNGLTPPPPTYVDLIDTTQIRRDLMRADSLGAEYKIVQIHWGQEYQVSPNQEQRELALFLHRHGVDAIIGSHPHVVQTSERIPADSINPRETYIIYSMGNFISNQRTPVSTRGGMLLRLDLERKSGQRHFSTTPSYTYVWVNKLSPQGKMRYQLRPVSTETFAMPSDLPEREQSEFRSFVKYYKAIPLVH